MVQVKYRGLRFSARQQGLITYMDNRMGADLLRFFGEAPNKISIYPIGCEKDVPDVHDCTGFIYVWLRMWGFPATHNTRIIPGGPYLHKDTAHGRILCLDKKWDSDTLIAVGKEAEEQWDALDLSGFCYGYLEPETADKITEDFYTKRELTQRLRELGAVDLMG